MKARISMATIPVLLIGVLLLQGCGKPESYGALTSDAKAATVADIMKAPEVYDGKAVRLEGKIVTECPSGCWFEMKDASGIIHVDIEPSGLAIPQRVGKKATVTGKVAVDGNQISVIGNGVKIQ